MSIQVQITQTYAKLGIDVSHGKVNMETKNAQLLLHHESAKLNIHNEFPRVQIDNRDCFNTSGLKDLETFAREYVQMGYQAASNYIAKIAGDGDALAAIENPGDPNPSIAIRDTNPEHEFGFDFMPKARPKITVSGNIQTTAVKTSEGANNGVEGTYNPGYIKYNVVPTRVTIHMQKYPSININFVGKNVDVYK